MEKIPESIGKNPGVISDPCPKCEHRLSFHAGPYMSRMANGVQVKRYRHCLVEGCMCASVALPYKQRKNREQR